MPLACPYLPPRQAHFRYIDGAIAAPYYRHLLDRGYRRSGGYLYRPVCDGCSKCQILRVPIATFTPTRDQRRVWRRGRQAFTTRVAPLSYTPEKLDMYRRYLQQQHGDPAADVDEARYRAHLLETCLAERSFELQLWHGGQLAGIGILDRLGDALSTVYFFFDPEFHRLSPGTYSALCEIELARAWGLAYYYLGYYIQACPSMSYKARFTPHELKELP